MESHADVDAARRKALAYVQDLIQGRYAGKSPLQVAEGFVDLAFESSNPIKDLFAVAATNGMSLLTNPPTLEFCVHLI